MVVIEDKINCCGCGACVQKCPVQCITLNYDEEGFGYPKVDEKKCINCNQCEKVCPLYRKQEDNQKGNSPSCFIAFNRDEDILKDSSSGGVFWLLVQNVIGCEGVVYGAVAEGFNVFHKRASTINECALFRKSKYLQSDTKETYKEALSDLKVGKVVLYSGTPCQIAGLYSFIGNKQFDNLITCEVICHGVPSLKAFNKWLDDLSKKHGGAKPVSMVWRDKIYGWGPNRITYHFDNSTTWTCASRDNLFQWGFLNNLYLRPSCYECHYARLPRLADFALADAWNYNGELLKVNNNKGLSIVILSTEKAKRIFNDIRHYLIFEETSIDYVKQCSRHVWKKPLFNKNRKRFFHMLARKNFETAAKKCLQPSLIIQVANKIKKLLHILFNSNTND